MSVEPLPLIVSFQLRLAQFVAHQMERCPIAHVAQFVAHQMERCPVAQVAQFVCLLRCLVLANMADLSQGAAQSK